MTRIVAGLAGGRRLAVPDRGTRPTTDRVRAALFSALAARRDFAGLRVLDLYAGSGALGLEALSRGAASVLLVEEDRRAARAIAGNIEVVGLPGAVLRQAPVAAVLAGPSQPMDLILADPPYGLAAAALEDVLGRLDAGGWASPGAVVVVERAASGPLLAWPPGWLPRPPRRYGDTRLEAADVPGDPGHRPC